MASASDLPGNRSDSRATSLTLLQRLRENEPDAWHAMVHLYKPLVYHWCGRSGVRDADADDVAQEVFGAAAGSLVSFRRERAGDTFRGWLRGITRNMVLLHFRRRSKHVQGSGGTDAFLNLQAVADSTPHPLDDQDPEPEIGGLYQRALELVRIEFEPKTWQAFWLTVVERQSPAAVADSLGMTPAGVRKAKSRVLRRVKEQVGDVIA